VWVGSWPGIDYFSALLERQLSYGEALFPAEAKDLIKIAVDCRRNARNRDKTTLRSTYPLGQLNKLLTLAVPGDCGDRSQ